MKKLVLALVLAGVAASASAVEVGVRGTLAAGDHDNALGLTVGNQYGMYGVEGAFDRTTEHDALTNRWSVAGTYNLAKINKLEITPKIGVAYIDRQNPGQHDDWATFAGVGASYPIAERVSLTADYTYQFVGGRQDENDNRFTLGVKYAF